MNKDYYELEELFKQCEEATQDLMLRMRALRDKMEEMRPIKVEKVIYEQYKLRGLIPGLRLNLIETFNLHDIVFYEDYTLINIWKGKKYEFSANYLRKFIVGRIKRELILTIIPSKKLIIIAEV